MGLKELDAVDWLDPPEPAALRQAVRELFVLTLTPHPYPCRSLPLSLTLALTEP